MRSPVSPISSAIASGMTASEHDSPAAGEESALDLGKTELGLIGSNDEIAREQELQAAPHRGRVRRADDRLRASAAQEPHVRARSPSGSPPARVPSLKSRRSMPAQNALSPVPVITIARTAGSASAASTPPPIPPSTAWLQRVPRLGTVDAQHADRAAILDDDFVR